MGIETAPRVTTAIHAPGTRRRRRRDPWVIGSYILVVGFLLVLLVPIAQMVSTAFKPTRDIFTSTPSVIFAPTFEHFAHVLAQLNFLSFILNSVAIAGVSTAVSLVLGVPAGYALSRLPLKGGIAWALAILLARMVPAIALVVPMYVLMSGANLLGSLTAVVLAHISFELPLIVWLMTSFFADTPRELEEAALVDGASKFGAFVRVALPLARPGIAVSAVLSVLLSWNEFLFVLVLGGTSTRTVPIGISAFIGDVNIDWGSAMAAATVALIPIFALGLGIQRFMIRGLTLGGVKG